MWTNPKFAKAAPGRAEAPPAESEKLAVFPRDKKGGGDDEELRIELCEYQCHRYVGLRIWFRSPQDGRFYPTKKGVTIRRGEIGDAIEALKTADRLIGGTTPRREQSAPRQAPRPLLELPGMRDFDEFE